MRGAKQLGPTVAAVLAVAVVGAAIWLVSAPPRGSGGYRERMGEATRTLRSQVQNARLWAGSFDRGEVTSAATAVALEEADRDAVSAASQFESYAPAAQDVALRSRFVALASDVTGALADLRIAAQLDEWHRIASLADPLGDLAAKLDRFEQRARP